MSKEEIDMPPACICQVAFVARRGTQCPHCGNEEIESADWENPIQVEGTYIYMNAVCIKCDYEWNDTFQLTGYCDTFMSCKGDDFISHLRKAANSQHQQKEEVRAMLAVWLSVAQDMVHMTKEPYPQDSKYWLSLFDKTTEVLGGTSVDPNTLPEEQA